MFNDHLLDTFILTQAIENTFNLITSVGENSLPRIFLVTGHIVVGVIASHNHQRQQHDLVVITGIDLCQNILNQRSALNGADKIVVVAYKMVCVFAS